MPAKNPRITLTLPSGLNRALEWWADKEGNRPATIAVSLIEQFVRDKIESGLIPMSVMSDEPGTTDASVIDTETKSSLESFLKLLANGECPSEETLIPLAQSLDIDPKLLVSLCKRIDGDSSTHPS